MQSLDRLDDTHLDGTHLDGTQKSLYVLLLTLLLASCTQKPDSAVSSDMVLTGEKTTENSSLNCQLPSKAPAANADFSAFANYSWQQFIALNWPALAGQRGVANCNVGLSAAGSRVWETYKTTGQLFLPNATDPGPWDGAESGLQSLMYVAKSNASLPVEDSIDQAVGGWLIDQNANPTYYSISVNETSYDYVRGHQYYNASILDQAAAITFPDGSLEVKAAWKILTSSDDASRYHSLAVKIAEYDASGKPTGNLQPATVGLVGMHIVFKAAGFPQWTWATFEQVDNVDQYQGHASYSNPNCSGDFCTPNLSPKSNSQPFTTPNQITRVTPLREDIIEVNSQWQASVKGTAFEYYQLISPQWPSDPVNPGNPQGTPVPGTVANVTMESYIQPTSSCMDCHSTARVPSGTIKSNYSFIFLFAQTPNTPST